MSDTKTTEDAYWRKVLQPDAYAALREGVMEAPFSGKFYNNTKIGSYKCRGCGTSLFSTDAVVPNGSGFLATNDIREGTVTLNKYYRTTGEEYSCLSCVKCGGAIGETEDIEIVSSDDLETGARKKTYLINSNAVLFAPALVPRNYPIATYLIFAIAVLGIGVVYVFSSTLVSVGQSKHVTEVVPLWVQDQRVDAKSLVINKGDHPLIVQDTFGVHETLFIVLPKRDVIVISFENITPQATLSWLTNDLKVISSMVLSGKGETLEVPMNAAYAYVSRKPESVSDIPKPGLDIIVVEKSALF